MRRKRKNLPTDPQEYPLGTCVKSENGYYFIKLDQFKKVARFPITSERVLDSYAFPRIALTTEAALGRYRIANAKIGFRDGSLIHNLSDGKIYLVAGNKRRHIRNPDVLERLGATEKDVVSVSAIEITLQQEGEPLD